MSVSLPKDLPADCIREVLSHLNTEDLGEAAVTDKDIGALCNEARPRAGKAEKTNLILYADFHKAAMVVAVDDRKHRIPFKKDLPEGVCPFTEALAVASESAERALSIYHFTGSVTILLRGREKGPGNLVEIFDTFQRRMPKVDTNLLKVEIYLPKDHFRTENGDEVEDEEEEHEAQKLTQWLLTCVAKKVFIRGKIARPLMKFTNDFLREYAATRTDPCIKLKSFYPRTVRAVVQPDMTFLSSYLNLYTDIEFTRDEIMPIVLHRYGKNEPGRWHLRTWQKLDMGRIRAALAQYQDPRDPPFTIRKFVNECETVLKIGLYGRTVLRIKSLQNIPRTAEDGVFTYSYYFYFKLQQ